MDFGLQLDFFEPRCLLFGMEISSPPQGYHVKENEWMCMKVTCKWDRIKQEKAGCSCLCSVFGPRKLAFGRSQDENRGVLLGKRMCAETIAGCLNSMARWSSRMLGCKPGQNKRV